MPFQIQPNKLTKDTLLGDDGFGVVYVISPGPELSTSSIQDQHDWCLLCDFINSQGHPLRENEYNQKHENPKVPKI